MKSFILLFILFNDSLIYVNGIVMIIQKDSDFQVQTKNDQVCFYSIWNGGLSEKICQSEISDIIKKLNDNVAMKNTNENDQLSLKILVQSSKFYRFGFYSLIIAMVGDLFISFLFSLFYSGYSNMKMSISILGNPKSPVRRHFNLWMLFEGILFLLALPALNKYYYPISSSVTVMMITFILLFAVGACIFTCFFSMNESKDDITMSSKIHEVGSALGFMLFLFVPLLVGILSFKNKEIIIGILSIIGFAAALLFFILFIMSDKESFSNSFINNQGLWQRLNLIFMYLPLTIVAIKRIIEKQGM